MGRKEQYPISRLSEEEIVYLYEGGDSIVELVKEAGKSDAYIRGVLLKHGQKIRKPGEYTRMRKGKGAIQYKILEEIDE